MPFTQNAFRNASLGGVGCFLIKFAIWYPYGPYSYYLFIIPELLAKSVDHVVLPFTISIGGLAHKKLVSYQFNMLLTNIIGKFEFSLV